VLRSLRYFWRQHLALGAGVAVTTAVLAGALVVGDSLQASLEARTRDRLGRVDLAASAGIPFDQDLARRLAAAAAKGEVATVVAALAVPGAAVHGDSGARSAQVAVLGVDEEFSALFPDASGAPSRELQGLFAPPAGPLPPVAVSAALARELGAAVGDPLVLSFERPGDVPRGSLLARTGADDVVGRLRLQVVAVLPDGPAAGAPPGPGGFALEPRQGPPRNAFVALPRLARALDQRGRANLLLAATGVALGGAAAPLPSTLEPALRSVLRPEDVGLRLVPADRWVTVESRQLVLSRPLAAAVERAATGLGSTAVPFLIHLANALEVGGRRLPYSTVAAIPSPLPPAAGTLTTADGAPAAPPGPDEVLLNAWAAQELQATPGQELTLTYYQVGVGDRLVQAEQRFRIAAVVAMDGLGADPSLPPVVPGVTDAPDMAGWDPPFPMDLGTIRPADEAYWDEHRAAPKALVALATGQALWQSRFGDTTSLRVPVPTGHEAAPFAAELGRAVLAELPLPAVGLAFEPVKARGLEAASGSTDWSALFLGFSLFLLVAAALLTGLLFRLAVEGRSREVGLLLALGYSPRRVRRCLLEEGMVVALAGTGLGAGLAAGYGALLLWALGRLWEPLLGAEAAGFLQVAATPRLLLGALASLFLVAVVLVLAVRRLARLPARVLLGGPAALPGASRDGRRARRLAALSLLATVGLLAAVFASDEPRPGLFFGLGAALLTAGLAVVAAWTRRPTGTLRAEGPTLFPMAAKNAARSPGRSLLAVILVASATFVLVAVGANRRSAGGDPNRRDSGTGGFALVAESQVPLFTDLAGPGGTADLDLSAGTTALLERARVFPLRLRPGEDASCLNLYQPRRPRVLGVPAALASRGGFRFHGTAVPGEDPWQLLSLDLPPERDDAGRPVPVVAALGDESSVRWILKRGLGEDLELLDDRGQTVLLRIVGLLSGSLFQSELLVSEEAFLRHFPSHGGYRQLLIEAPPADAAALATALEKDLAVWGLDAVPAADRLASFLAVENLYLSTFQALGGLGLLLGTLGLGVILWRNVLERRGELALLRALGYRRGVLHRLVLAETVLLLAFGLGLGSLAGLAAVAPQLVAAPEAVPWGTLALTLAAVAAVGMAACGAAVAAVAQVPLLPALKAE
jgi:ABC-type lipoprotein release transport system permease subunit